jgi:hypothetical protein
MGFIEADFTLSRHEKEGENALFKSLDGCGF